ncbi:hypothetical protein HY086_03990 [Candidatus Gottesmanbacteria bacterium]|nr:hypothetical protein [Candidatus Gottesmanbacteria bacterium]
MYQKSSLKKFSPIAYRVVCICILVALIAQELLLLQRSRQILPLCQQKLGSEKETCFIRAVQTTLRQKGVAGAFQKLDTLYRADPSFSVVCHSLTHEIGAYAYEQFVRDQKFSVSRDFAACSYGFYHGFMERLAGQPDVAEKARTFCDEVDRQMRNITPDATLQCYHGIGHGFVNNHDPATWGDETKLIGPALALCERVSTTQSEKSRCATGVFNGIATFYNEKLYNLAVNSKDPLWICGKEKKEYQDPCYISLNITLLELTNGDIVKAAKFFEPIADDVMAVHAMINLAAPVGTKNINSRDHQESVAACRSVAPRLRLACIQGYAFGMLEHGIPGREYEKPLAFCGSTQLTSAEGDACYQYIIGYLPQWYPKEKVLNICADLPVGYRQRCL